MQRLNDCQMRAVTGGARPRGAGRPAFVDSLLKHIHTSRAKGNPPESEEIRIILGKNG